MNATLARNQELQLIQQMRASQLRWSAVPIDARVKIVRAVRHDIAEGAIELAATVPLDQPGHLHRTLADTLCSEVLPLAEACRFLESEATRLLSPVRSSARAKPAWLRRVSVEIRREPLGLVLIVGPGNYPLFLPGVQALQALVAGNAVLWKPAAGGSSAAHALRALLAGNGLDPQLLTILPDSPDAAQQAIEGGVDKVIFTGSAETGRAVLRSLAGHLTPSVMELSGCDAVFVLDGADLDRVAEAIAFGMRFNGSATCMAPRRLIFARKLAAEFLPKLIGALVPLEVIPVSRATHAQLIKLVSESKGAGARILLDGLQASKESHASVGVTLIDNANASLRAARTDIFAPILTILYAESEQEALEVHRECPYSLGAAVFGPGKRAEAFAGRIHAGMVLVNDVLIPSADPRASFGGLGMSGFGATRGAAGLLEMTAAKSIVVQKSRSRRAWAPTTSAHVDLFAAFLRLLHGKHWRQRLRALRDLISCARGLRS